MTKNALPRYRFGPFTLSPAQRMLLQGDRELRLIPRYLDLLIFLVEHRHQAVHRRDIFERVWSDVIVSDSALAQAVRTLRRALGDDPRDPVFIRTIARHGYQFVFSEVVEEQDEGRLTVGGTPRVPETEGQTDNIDALLDRLTTPPHDAADEDLKREAAERLHVLGTRTALDRLGTRSGHQYARALLRDTRWDVPGAGEVPLIGQPATLDAAVILVKLRLRHLGRLASRRCLTTAVGGGVAGGVGGAIGGALVSIAPGSAAPPALSAVLAIIGAACGAWGGAGVGFGLSMGEAVARSRRTLATIAGAAVGGGLAGLMAQWVARSALTTLVGVHLAVGGAVEGVVIGAAAGLGLAPALRHIEVGFGTPRGRRRALGVALTAATCGLAALLLALWGASLVGGTIHAIAQASSGSEAALTPLSRLLGEPDFGPVTRALVATGEGAMFGLGVAMGLTHRPRMASDSNNSTRSHTPLISR